MAKILIIDIETAPNIAYVWGAWKQNIGQNQWKQKAHIMSFAAKWLGEEGVFYEENRTSDDSRIVKTMFDLLDEADIAVAHNGRKFDFPTIIGRGLVHGYAPPSPYHVVDTLDTARREFRFTNNTLANLTQELGILEKGGHKKFPGFELWLECLRGNEEAWDEMREYNIRDVEALEELYLRLLPFMKSHPNVVRGEKEGVFCPKCGSDNIQWRGYYYTKAGMCYKRFQCMDCGGWGRVRHSEKDIRHDGRNAT
ncbi:MAG: hypothetical protein CMN30_31895 [Sandaracinus sp.]|nr:hypothetical protein [Sandaracinus sp.]